MPWENTLQNSLADALVVKHTALDYVHNIINCYAKVPSSDLVKKVLLPIPVLIEQQRLVSIIGSIASETKRLEVIYQRKLTALIELIQSILQKAFAGELTAEIFILKAEATA